MSRAQFERQATCEALLSVGPDAPTLCEGWDAHDLAAHLWLRENEPLTALGMFAPALESRTDRRMKELRIQLRFDELVDLIRNGPPRLSAFALPGVDEAANALEFLIHGLDVRRPSGLPEPVRDEATQRWAWRQLRRAAPFMLRSAPVGLVLEWAQRPDHQVHASKGDRIVTVVGTPVELLLYASGRRDAAEVELVGLPEALAALNR